MSLVCWFLRIILM
nr:unnamed protein product [Callosobruchus analis]